MTIAPCLRSTAAKLMVAVGLFLVSSCDDSSDEKDGGKKIGNVTKISVLLAPSGRGDKSYNDAALSPFKDGAFKNDKSIQVSELLPGRPDENIRFIERVATKEVDLIIGVGFLYSESFQTASKQYPNVNFLLLDSVVKNAKNVRSVTFRADEGSFLAGVAAASETKTKSVGFVGGMDIPIIQSFQCGFDSGVEWASAELSKTVAHHAIYLGVTPSAFSNPKRGEELASVLIERKNTDILFHAAGASGNGVIAAAKRAKVKAIGVDTDQSHLAEGVVITSMRKRLDLSVLDAVMAVKDGSFNGGDKVMSVTNKGVDIVLPGLLGEETQGLVEKAKGIAAEIVKKKCASR